MKKWIGICILCLVLSGCRNNDVSDSKIASTPSASTKILENEKVVLVICPTSAMYETYSIELSQNRILTTTMGTRKEDISDIKRFEKDDFYVRIEKKESVALSDNEFSTVDKLIDKIETEDNSRYENYEDIWNDTWASILLTPKGVYYFILHDIEENSPNSSICKLYYFLKEKSPIEIDRHSWA